MSKCFDRIHNGYEDVNVDVGVPFLMSKLASKDDYLGLLFHGALHCQTKPAVTIIFFFCFSWVLTVKHFHRKMCLLYIIKNPWFVLAIESRDIFLPL